MSEIGTYRIGFVARVTGLSVAVLRAWDERYGLGATARSSGGQRLYSRSDILRVEQVKKLTAEGWTVASAAAAVTAEKSEAVPDEPTAAPAVPEAVPTPEPSHPTADPGQPDALSISAAYQITRALLRAECADEIPQLLDGLVERLGGRVVCSPGPRETIPDGDLIPVDVSLGRFGPRLVSAPPGSPARQRLEAVLPWILEDARHVLAGLESVRPPAA